MFHIPIRSTRRPAGRAAPTAAAGGSTVLERPRLGLASGGSLPDGHEPNLIYQGTRVRNRDRIGEPRVLVITTDGIAPLPHFPFHSSGFDWGYLGRGPADLARCVLLHHHGVLPTASGSLYPPVEDELPVSYHEFLSEVIAPLPHFLLWTLTREQVSAWVTDHT